MVLFVFFIVANLSGCSMSAAEIKENPAGHSISDVIISWGAPNLTAEIEGGGKVYTWIACDASNHCCNQNMVTDSNGIVVDYTESGSCR